MSENKEVNMADVMRDLTVRREQKWDNFFAKYDGMDDVIEDEIMPEYDESYMSDENQLNEEEDDDEIDEDINLDNSINDDSCIEVSDEEANDFTSTFKEVAQTMKVQLVENIYEEDFSNDIRTKEGRKRTVESTRKSIRAVHRSSMIDSPISSPMVVPNALQRMGNLAITNTSANGNCNALANMTQGAAGADPFKTINELTCSEFIKRGNRKFLQQVTTVTTTTTTTTIIQHDDHDEISTPKKVNSVKQPKSTKKPRRSDELPDLDVPDNEIFTTPTTRKQRSGISNLSGTCEVTITPNRKTVAAASEDFIKTMIKEVVPKTAKKGVPYPQAAARDVIHKRKDATLSLIYTTPVKGQPLAIMAPKASEDFVYQGTAKMRPIVNSSRREDFKELNSNK